MDGSPDSQILALQDASSAISVSPCFLDKRFDVKSCVSHSGCLLALPWGFPLEEMIFNSVKSQSHRS